VIDILAEKIRGGRFLWLIDQMLKAGYLEDWRWHATLIIAHPEVAPRWGPTTRTRPPGRR
jgi:hypothetical protein